jgi:hypothetical protein
MAEDAIKEVSYFVLMKGSCTCSACMALVDCHFSGDELPGTFDGASPTGFSKWKSPIT